jgi:hypothetical protein
VAVFGMGLLGGGYASPNQEPGVILKLYHSHAFGETTVASSMQHNYSFTWLLNSGFWLAIATALLAFLGAIVPSSYKKSVAQVN